MVKASCYRVPTRQTLGLSSPQPGLPILLPTALKSSWQSGFFDHGSFVEIMAFNILEDAYNHPTGLKAWPIGGNSFMPATENLAN